MIPLTCLPVVEDEAILQSIDLQILSLILTTLLTYSNVWVTQSRDYMTNILKTPLACLSMVDDEGILQSIEFHALHLILTSFFICSKVGHLLYLRNNRDLIKAQVFETSSIAFIHLLGIH